MICAGIPAWGVSAGSGFFISDNGYFVTNYHVVAGGKVFAVRTVNDKRYSAKLVRIDQANDLAILKLEGEFTPLPIDDSLPVKRGAKVVTIGFPHSDIQGVEPKVTEGIVNSLTGARDDPRYFQVSVQIGNGNSGGPLINMNGNVVGIVSAKLSANNVFAQSGDLVQNVNYAIKSNYLRELANSIPDLQEKLLPANKDTYTDTETLVASIGDAIGLVINFSVESDQTDNLPRAGPSFRDCTNCPEMVPLPRSDKISRPFAIAKFEITQGQWRTIMGENPSYFRKCGDTCPVEQIDWDDAVAFTKKLTQITGKQYRLPTVDEWEFACRAGRPQQFCGSDSIDSVAWYLGNSRGTSHPAGRKLGNAFALYDMSGNVWEWTSNCADASCSKHILKGGSWLESSQFIRAIDSDAYESDKSFSFTGLRVVRNMP